MLSRPCVYNKQKLNNIVNHTDDLLISGYQQVWNTMSFVLPGNGGNNKPSSSQLIDHPSFHPIYQLRKISEMLQ